MACATGWAAPSWAWAGSCHRTGQLSWGAAGGAPVPQLVPMGTVPGTAAALRPFLPLVHLLLLDVVTSQAAVC